MVARSSGSSAETSHVATASTGTVAGAVDAGGQAGEAFAHDDGSGREIAEALIAPGRDHGDHAADVQHRQEVDDPQDVADRAGEEPDRLPENADDPDARRDLPDGPAAVEHLERHVVPEEHQEHGDPQHRAHDAGRRCEGDAERERDDDRALDERVEEAGDEAGTDSGEHELERDALRRRDRHAVVEEHVTNLDEFVRERTPTWTELERLVEGGGNSPARLGSAGVLRLGSCYRAVAADLAFARRRFPSDPIVGRLERLTQRGRHAVYNTSGSRNTVLAFATRGYWRRVRERPALLVIAVVCLALPTLLSGYWAWRDPGAASGLAPSAYQSVTQPRPDGQDLGVSVDEQSDLAARIFTNNIQVSFLAFAGGILLGLGTLYLLIENGIMLGAVAGLAIGAGNGRPFFELVVAHGVLELSCIVVAGCRGCGSRRRSSTRARVRVWTRCAPRRGPRSRSCSAPRCGSSSPGSSRAFSRPRARASPSCWSSASVSARSTGASSCGAVPRSDRRLTVRGAPAP